MSYKIIKNNSIQLSDEKVEVTRKILEVDTDIKMMDNHLEDLEPVENEEVLQGLNFNEKKKEYESLVEELEREKEAILQETLENAKLEAEKILKDARSLGYEAGHKEGYNAGYKEGIDKGNEEVEILIGEAYETLKKAKLEAIDYLKREEVNIIRLAGKMAQRIVNHEIEASSQTVIDMITPVLSEFKDGGMVIITCNKKDGHKFRDNIPLLKDINKNVEYMIIETPQMDINKFSLEYGNQFIDVDTKKQIETMIKELFSLEVMN